MHPHKNFDIIETVWVCLYKCMIFYSTKKVKHSFECDRTPFRFPTECYANATANFVNLRFDRQALSIQEIYLGEISEIFSFSEASINIMYSCLSLLKSFHPFLLTGKPQTFSFSEAPKKNRRVKGFSLASSQKF